MSMKQKPNLIPPLAVIGTWLTLTLNRCGGEIFTNPFLLRGAFLTEGDIVRMITGFGIDQNTSLGEAIEGYVRVIKLDY